MAEGSSSPDKGFSSPDKGFWEVDADIRKEHGLPEREAPHSKEYADMAQHCAEGFIKSMAEKGFSAQQIHTIIGEVLPTWYGVNGAGGPEITSPKDQERLETGIGWVTEVTSRAQYKLFNMTSQDQRFKPNEILAKTRPTNQDVRASRRIEPLHPHPAQPPKKV